jgi:CheY-like chemotaxis protein
MGGDIWVKSELYKGSEFAFVLPFKLIENTQKKRQNSQFKKHTVLLVDESEVSSSIIKEMLEPLFTHIIVTRDLDESLEVVKKESISLVVANIKDVSNHWYRQLQQVKESALNQEVSFILILSMAMNYDQARLNELGVSCCIRRPVKQGELVKACKIGLGLTPRREDKPHDEISIKNEKGINILVVEDNKTTQKFIQGLLSKEGYNVTLADSAEDAFPFLAKYPYDLVIMDIVLPNMDGLTAIRMIRSDRSKVLNTRIPILVATTLVKEQDRQQCFEVGADDFITKPIQFNELFKKIKRLTKEKQENGEQARAVEEATGTADTQPETSLFGTANDDDRLAEFKTTLPQKIEKLRKNIMEERHYNAENLAKSLQQTAKSIKKLTMSKLLFKIILNIRKGKKEEALGLINNQLIKEVQKFCKGG